MFKSLAVSPHLPAPRTTFVGRRADLAEINSLLATPTCRLLTLVGPGGIGKTRLALEAAANAPPAYRHGVHFVPLQPLRSADYLASAMAEALHLPLAGHDDPQVQLLTYLHDKHTLLVLDNFEHLLAGAELLGDLLAAAPGVKLLVTSREVLHLQEEWLYPVRGLPVPESEHVENVADYSAVALFVERARRRRPDFSPADERAAIARICRLVEGLPLALELAAAWTRTLSCEAIAAEIASSLDFLATRWRDVPERHRSMQAVFDQTWQALSEEEQRVFSCLAVFRGGFRREAAQVVSGGALQTLSALVDKSLLRLEGDGRYQIHELLRQYAEERLRTSDRDAVQTAHAEYYTRYLAERQAGLLGHRQRETAAEVQAELENIRAAWEWSVAAGHDAAIGQAVEPLAQFYQMQSRFREGAAAFAKAAERLASAPPADAQGRALAVVLAELGWLYVRLGRLAEAETALTQSVGRHERLGLPPVTGIGTDPRLGLGFVACARGDYARAAALGEQAREMSERHPQPWNRYVADDLLSRAALYQGQLEVALAYARRAYAGTQAAGDAWFMGYCLNQLGNVAYALQDYAAAQSHYAASYRVRKDLDDPEGMAVALNHLGQVAMRQGQAAEAGRVYEQSRAIYERIGDAGGLVTSLTGLGHAALAQGNEPAARPAFAQALQIASERQFMPHTFAALVAVTDWLLNAGRTETGLAALALLHHHPAAGHEIREQAQHLAERFGVALAVDGKPATRHDGTPPSLETVVARVQHELVAAETGVGSPLPARREAAPTAQPLIEPLSDRELEVLRLVAAGLSNPQIAQQLFIAVGTVKAHVHSICGKLSAGNRVQAIARARELGLL